MLKSLPIIYLGKFGKTWPGLNTPVQVTPRKSKKKYKENYLLKPQMSEVAATRPKKGQISSQFAVERKQSKEMPEWKKAFLEGEKMYGQDLSRRGWSGKTWRGREFGPPEMTTGGNRDQKNFKNYNTNILNSINKTNIF